jgi:glycosyltransferase involved in cell wall biosynthesis
LADSYSRKHKNIKVVHRGKGINGMGAALKEGTRIAKGKYIVWVMADNSDDLNAIPKFVSKLKDNFDMVFGSRYIKNGSRGDLGAFKAILSSGYSFAAGLIFGFESHDITNAFRAFKKEIFNNIALESNDFAISPEFAIKAHLKGYRLGEVPTTYKNRKAGTTKFRLIKMGAAYCRLFKYKFIQS